MLQVTVDQNFFPNSNQVLQVPKHNYKKVTTTTSRYCIIKHLVTCQICYFWFLIMLCIVDQGLNPI